MKKLLVALALLLFWVGLCMIVFGTVYHVWRTIQWSENAETEAAKLCRPDEELAITRRDTGIRVYYTFYCDDAQGNRRDLSDEISKASHGLNDMGIVFAGIGGVLGGILFSGLAVWYNKRANRAVV
ncbi:MAG: hypothetical protein F9K46_05905 [Anaerolineae bacterium]|nr:MAG: hypothetical protein F9K46_05905 [Anaerolineae bacterium]